MSIDLVACPLCDNTATVESGKLTCYRCGILDKDQDDPELKQAIENRSRRDRICDVTQSCVLTNELIADLEGMLRSRGVAVPDMSDTDRRGSLAIVEMAEEGRGCASLQVLIRTLRSHMKEGVLEIDLQVKPDKTAEWRYVLDGDGVVSNECIVLRHGFHRLSAVLEALREYESLAKWFLKVSEGAAFSFEGAKDAVGKLIRGTNQRAIAVCVDVLKLHEPDTLEIRQGEARIRQLEAGVRGRSIDELTGTEFEHLLERELSKLGFVVRAIGSSGDFGADLLLDAHDGTVVAIQAKRYKRKVNLKAVQEVHGALSIHQADLGIVITNAGFFPSAIRLASEVGVELWGANELWQLLEGDLSHSQIESLVRRVPRDEDGAE